MRNACGSEMEMGSGGGGGEEWMGFMKAFFVVHNSRACSPRGQMGLLLGRSLLQVIDNRIPFIFLL